MERPSAPWTERQDGYTAGLRLSKILNITWPDLDFEQDTVRIDAKELQILTDQTRAVADAILDNAGVKVSYTVGTMVETPRAALLADQIAEVAGFISFGTNDLTQTTMGLSRDDAGRFLPAYVDHDKHAIFKDDPFTAIDVEGAGQLVRMAVDRSRSVRRNFKLGVCGEHGGESKSISFFHDIGLDYVSCSPLRVPIARLAAAQAVIATSPARTTKRNTPRRPKAATKKPTAKKTKKALAARTSKTTKSKRSAKKKTTPRKKSARRPRRR